MFASKLARLTTGGGYPAFDNWIDNLCGQIEAAQNVAVTPPLRATRGPNGLVLACEIPPATRIAKASSGGIPARVGTTLGKADDVVLYDLNEGTLTSETVTETVYNMSTTSVAANSYVMLTRLGKYWIVNFEDCQ